MPILGSYSILYKGSYITWNNKTKSERMVLREEVSSDFTSFPLKGLRLKRRILFLSFR